MERKVGKTTLCREERYSGLVSRTVLKTSPGWKQFGLSLTLDRLFYKFLNQEISRKTVISMLVTRVERHIVDMNQQLIDLSYASKNLYNCATFIMRQNFIKNHKIINYRTMDKIIKRDYPKVYKGLPAQSSQQVLKLVDNSFQSFFKANQEYKQNPDKFKGRPKLPKYKDIDHGLNIVIFTNQQCRLTDNQIRFPKKRLITCNKCVSFQNTSIL